MVCESEINTRFARFSIVGSGTLQKQFFKKSRFIESGTFRRLSVISTVNWELSCPRLFQADKVPIL